MRSRHLGHTLVATFGLALGLVATSSPASAWTEKVGKNCSRECKWTCTSILCPGAKKKVCGETFCTISQPQGIDPDFRKREAEKKRQQELAEAERRRQLAEAERRRQEQAQQQAQQREAELKRQQQAEAERRRLVQAQQQAQREAELRRLQQVEAERRRLEQVQQQALREAELRRQQQADDERRRRDQTQQREAESQRQQQADDERRRRDQAQQREAESKRRQQADDERRRQEQRKVEADRTRTAAAQPPASASATGVAAGTATATAILASARDLSLWTHNGSQMKVAVDGERIAIAYDKPRQGLGDLGINNGTPLFVGTKIGSSWRGEATTFSSRCGARKFEVNGDHGSDARKIELRGRRPNLNNNCETSGYRDETLVFDLIKATSP